ncbi:hypothetical protein ACWC5I_25955 [Kitasatospora sp. NPDC001574]
MTPGFETRHNGLLARACTWQGWNLLTITEDQNYQGPLPALRLIGASTLPNGQPGRIYQGQHQP